MYTLRTVQTEDCDMLVPLVLCTRLIHVSFSYVRKHSTFLAVLADTFIRTDQRVKIITSDETATVRTIRQCIYAYTLCPGLSKELITNELIILLSEKLLTFAPKMDIPNITERSGKDVTLDLRLLRFVLFCLIYFYFH